MGLIYNMNVGDAQMYRELTEKHRASFERFLGETFMEYAQDTLQFADYGLYVGDSFDEAHKRQRNRRRNVYSVSTLWLNLSSSSAITMPQTMQITLTRHWDTDAVKLEKGMIITVAAMTMPMIPWKAME